MPLEAITDVFDAFEDGDRKRLVVVNRTEPDAIQRLFDGAFGGEVSVDEIARSDTDADLVVLLDGEEVVATSSLTDVMNAFLLINSDLFRTSSRGLNMDLLPDVLRHLDEEVLELRGYPASNKEKLLLIAVSRYIEGLALQANGGRLDSAFQRLSRLEDEYGTRDVYDRLAASDVSVCLYGVSGAGWIRDERLDVTVKTGTDERYRRSWFVVFSPADPDATHAALVCWEQTQNTWRGTWTFDPAWVSAIQDCIVDTY